MNEFVKKFIESNIDLLDMNTTTSLERFYFLAYNDLTNPEIGILNNILKSIDIDVESIRDKVLLDALIDLIEKLHRIEGQGEITFTDLVWDHLNSSCGMTEVAFYNFLKKHETDLPDYAKLHFHDNGYSGYLEIL